MDKSYNIDQTELIPIQSRIKQTELSLIESKDKLLSVGKTSGECSAFGFISGLYGICTLSDGNIGKGLICLGGALLFYGIGGYMGGVAASKKLNRISELESKLISDKNEYVSELQKQVEQFRGE